MVGSHRLLLSFRILLLSTLLWVEMGVLFVDEFVVSSSPVFLLSLFLLCLFIIYHLLILFFSVVIGRWEGKNTRVVHLEKK
jgi:hypothetical protein